MPIKTQSTRRAFLRTLAGSSFAAVALRHFVSAADAGAYPLRFLFVYTSAGRDVLSRCTGTGTDFTFGGGYAPLEAVRDEVLVLDGLRIPDHVDEEHPNGRAAMLTGLPSSASRTAQGISIDRFLAKHLSAGFSVYAGSAPPGGDIDIPISWHADGIENDAFIAGEEALMAELFSGMEPAPMDPAVDDTRRANELSLNAFLSDEVRRLEQIAPAEERAKLALHLEALAQLRADLERSGTPGGVPLASCSDGVVKNGDTETDRMNQILAHALACGSTRVAVVRMGLEGPHHEYSHWNDGSDYLDKLRALDRQYSEHFARLLGYLKAFPEGDGTLLDNTIVVWSSEVSGDHGEELHSTVGMPFILAGGKSAGLRRGERVVAEGRNNTELYRAIALAMGVSDSAEFGDSGSSEPLVDIFA